VHRKIEIDEKFHVGLGRQILARYAKTDDDRKEILRAMRGMHDIALNMFAPESATRLLMN
jgi:1,2-phenylacetyl-CoA epoxidase catalytic subunit